MKQTRYLTPDDLIFSAVYGGGIYRWSGERAPDPLMGEEALSPLLTNLLTGETFFLRRLDCPGEEAMASCCRRILTPPGRKDILWPSDLVFLPMYYQPASLILAQAQGMSYAPKWFGVDGMDGILTMDGFDTTLAEGVMLLTPFNADAEDQQTKDFVAKYQEKYNEIPNQFAADAYDCVYAYYQALTNAKATTDMDASTLCDLMIQQFTTMTFNGLTGSDVTWDSTGAVSKQPKGMVIQNGAYVGLD